MQSARKNMQPVVFGMLLLTFEMAGVDSVTMVEWMVRGYQSHKLPWFVLRLALSRRI